MHDTACDACATDDEEHILPSVDALTAGTLALMTGYAQSAADCPHRGLMARKLLSNLFFLSEHPHVSQPMRAMLVNLRASWQSAAEAVPAAELGRQPSPLWHVAPDHMQ